MGSASGGKTGHQQHHRQLAQNLVIHVSAPKKTAPNEDRHLPVQRLSALVSAGLEIGERIIRRAAIGVKRN